MKKKMFCVLMVTLILTGVLNAAFIAEPLFAQMDENNVDTFGESKYLKVKEDRIHEQTLQDFNDISEWSKIVYVNGDKTRLIVGVNGEGTASFSKFKDIAKRHQATIVNSIRIKGEIIAFVVELPLSSVTAFVQETRIMELASYIEPNMRVQAQFVPNDPYWSLQWGPQRIGADWAWNTTVGTYDILVAVVDTGIYYYHADLAANYLALGYDWVNMDDDPLDDHGHGTHCAGIIAATINNGIGIAGLAQVRIMAEKVLTSGGWGYWDWVASGIIHATESGANIISLSLGGYGYSELVHEAVKYAYNNGVLLVAAAGNDNTNTKLYPAGYDEVIAVAATDQYDQKAWFSNWGNWIELAAPGVDICSTVPWGYESWSGTSMSAPHVSGVAALVWSLYPNKTRDWVRLWLRYVVDDLGNPGFDVYFGYGRINARKAVEQTPPTHELIAYEWRTPPYVEPGALAIINATVLNFGKSNETDIIVQILANNTIVNSTMIGFLPNGGSTTVSLAWNPTVEGLYNVTLYVVPVPGETSVKDNVLGAYIYVGFPVKAVVLHSAGNVYSEIITNWQVLNTEWHRFGDTMVFIDYTTLNKEDITYEDIASTEADVLIISCAYDPWIGWQFTDSEIEAIKRYVYEGHGLIATAGTFYYYVPNNNKLASLFGLNETTMWTATETDLLHLLNITHPLFKNVPNPLVFSDVGTALPYDGRWDQNELVDGAYLALGHYRESAIVARRGLVYISPWFEIIPAYYHHHLQLLYNAITWSRYQKPNHELIVSLETPKHLTPDESTLLNTTVSNMGLSNETNVELFLLINGTIIDSATIPELLTGSSYTLSYLWTPTIEGIYNVTAYVPPVPDEEYIRNNVASVNVRVRYVIARVAILNSWEIPPYFTGGWGNDYQTLVDALNAQGFYAQAVTNAEIISGTLSFFDVFVMVDNVPNDAAVPWVIDFWSNGGGVIAFDSSICFLCYAGILPPESAGSNGYYVYWDYGTGYQARIAAAHPITEGYEVGQIILGTSVDAEYWVDALAGSSAYPYYTMLVEDITTSNRAYVSAYEPPMAGKVVHMWDEYHWRNVDLQLMILNAMEWAAAPKYEHDLAVTLDAPRFLEWGKSIILNATVTNCGLNNETSIELQLLINGTIVDYVLIPELWVEASYTLSYYWAPTTGGVSYNVTAYALPVTGENFTLNNRVTRMVYVSFYAREYLPPEWGGGGVPMGWHADDNCWQYTLPFDFPFYGIYYRTIYISSNGLITFTSPDASWSNSIYALAGKLAIAPAWDDWVTYEPYDIFIWENSTHVSVRWYVRAYGSSTIASFEAILCVNGIIQFNYAYNDGPISATIGISNGAGDILAEDVITLNYINTIVFTPAFTPAPPIQLTATVEFHQQTLNLNSCGKWITAHIELPEGYSVADIDVATIMLNGIISAELEPAIIGDYDGDGIPDLSVYFNRTQLIKYIFFKGIGYGNVTLTISGMLYDGMPFKGRAAIKVSNLVGDVNCNGKVDIYDIIIAATSYGSKEGEPNWNSNANYAPPWDKIDILDIVTIIYHYGKTYP